MLNLQREEPTPASIWHALAGIPITDELLEWPPDLFALTEVILERSEAYRFILSPPSGVGRQVTAVINDGTTTATSSYVYDGLGQRVSTTTSVGQTIFVYDAFGNLAAEYGANDPSPCGTPTCYVTVDHLGSTRMLTDSTGSSNVRRYDY